jgi:hypothetical protein
MRFAISGGEGGIRTRGGYNPSHAFQACDLNRSSTSPEVSILADSHSNFAASGLINQQKSRPQAAFHVNRTI